MEVIYRPSLRASDVKGSEFDELADVIAAFGAGGGDDDDAATEATGDAANDASSSAEGGGKAGAGGGAEDGEEDEDEWELDEMGNPVERDGVSNRSRRKLTRLSVAELKSRAAHPEVVELQDVAAPDPALLVHLKAARHSVPVPSHWRQKRKYLMGKRALEKTTFELPKFISDTGIADVRDRALEEDAKKSLKQKMRDKVRPKLGRVAVDYEILHDAFFKHQSKPRLSAHGETYFEGKDGEKDRSHMRPGVISAALREALTLPAGHPPPWLVQMQRYGPPPSYPSLRVPGLNAPIPEGASWGHGPGQWGHPPIDIHGKPLYGDPFASPDGAAENAVSAEQAAALVLGAPTVPRRWGEVDSDAEDEEDDVLRAEEEQEEEDDDGGAAKHAAAARAGAEAGDGTSSVLPGAETPAELELRKPSSAAAAASAGSGLSTPAAGAVAAPRALFKVLKQTSADGDGGIMAGASHKYVIPSDDDGEAAAAAAGLAKTGSRAAKRARGTEATVALDPSELEGLTAEEVEAKLLRSREHAEGAREREELDALLREHQRTSSSKRRKKDKKDNDFF